MADQADPGRGREDLSDRWSSATGRPHKVVQINDARGIRAIAHEARQQILQAMFVDTQKTFTATDLSTLTGLSPSAMSYHLRALEKWGVIERAPDDGGDARNRPWRAAGTQLNITGGDDPGTSAARMAFFDRSLDDLRRRLDGYQHWPREARRVFVGSSRGQLWLTPEQIAWFGQAVERAELDLLESDAVTEPGPGKIRVAHFFSLLPTEDQDPSLWPDDSTDDSDDSTDKS